MIQAEALYHNLEAFSLEGVREVLDYLEGGVVRYR